jgi:hypothetical protein
MTVALPDPQLTLVYRLDAAVGTPLEIGDFPAGRRRIVPLTGGTFTGPKINGTLVAGVSADWQIVQPDGTALGDIRYVLKTDAGDLLYVQSRGVRHGSAEVLARLARVHLPDVDTDRGIRARTRLAEQGHLHQRRRASRGRCHLRDVSRLLRRTAPHTTCPLEESNLPQPVKSRLLYR